MIRIAITQAAFDAIAATLPLGSVSFENAFNERGERYVWLPPNVVDRLKAQRRAACLVLTPPDPRSTVKLLVTQTGVMS